jgi:hypothetical protein
MKALVFKTHSLITYNTILAILSVIIRRHSLRLRHKVVRALHRNQTIFEIIVTIRMLDTIRIIIQCPRKLVTQVFLRRKNILVNIMNLIIDKLLNPNIMVLLRHQLFILQLD